jgi:hypothetical protein
VGGCEAVSRVCGGPWFGFNVHLFFVGTCFGRARPVIP